MTSMTLADKILENPLSAVSVRNFDLLDESEKRVVILKLIEDAVYCDAWEAYFEYAQQNSISLTNEVAFESVHAVGLDVFSVHLWTAAARCCSDSKSRREIYQLGLSVPLYEQHLLYREYRASEGLDSINVTESNETFCQLLEREQWPDRYTCFRSDLDRIEVRRQWVSLLEIMKTALADGVLEKEIQIRRMILAYRQMCAQLPEDDSCWYDYCLFLLDTVGDKELALQTALAGLRAVKQDSFALHNIVSIVTRHKSEAYFLSSSLKALFLQRVLGEDLVNMPPGSNKESLKRFRRIGKLAASEGVADWKVYSQWSMCEHFVVQDLQMASKVLENGVACCSTSPDDAILLQDEAIQYHLAQHHEREVLGYAEQQVEEASVKQDVGRRKAAWNCLVSVENKLGLSLSKAEKRRNEAFPRIPLKSFLEKVRVGCYLPCSKPELDWVHFLEDFDARKNSEMDPTFRWMDPPRERKLSPVFQPRSFVETVDEAQWAALAMPLNPFEPKESEEPDTVVGPREFCGKLVYRVQVDKLTKARLQREDRVRKAQGVNNETFSNSESPLGRLLKLFKAETFSEKQKQQVQSISIEWLISQLISSELNLSESLKKRVRKL